MKIILTFEWTILICLLIHFVHGMDDDDDEIDERPRLDCKNFTEVDSNNYYYSYYQHIWAFEDLKACCGDEKYQLGTGDEFLKHFQNCNEEPANVTMSFEDCHWTIYECIILKNTGLKEITLPDYVELMTKNLTEEKRSAISSLISKDMKTPPINSNGNTQLEPIKTAFEQYFQVEQQVCSSSFPESFRKFVEEFWIPADNCISGRMPKIFPFPYDDDDTMKCLKYLDDKYESLTNTSYHIKFRMFPACIFIANGFFAEADLSRADFDGEAVFSKMTPNFLSKSVKEMLRSQFLNHTSVVYPPSTPSSISAVPSGGIKETVDRIRNINGDFLMTIAVADLSTAPDAKHALVNILTIHTIFHALHSTMDNMCRGSQGSEAEISATER